MSLVWYDVHSPSNRYAIGQIEVDNGKIIRTTNAYRWAIGLYFEDFNDQQFKKGYHIAKRFEPWAQTLGTDPSTYKKPAPSDRELFKRISP